MFPFCFFSPFSGDRHTDIISNGHLASRSRNQTTLVGCPRTSSKASLMLLWDSDTRLGLGLRSEKVNRHQKRLVKGRTLSLLACPHGLPPHGNPGSPLVAVAVDFHFHFHIPLSPLPLNSPSPSDSDLDSAARIVGCRRPETFLFLDSFRFRCRYGLGGCRGWSWVRVWVRVDLDRKVLQRQ